MAARLSDKQRKRICADYLELQSYNAVAKKHGISKDTVRRIVLNSGDFVQKAQQKKDENTADILAHMESKKSVVNQIIDRYLLALLDEDKISSATTNQLTTALGTLIDKFTGIKKNAGAGQSREDDPLSAALKEMAQNMMGDKNAGQQ